MASVTKPLLTPEQYLERERLAEYRSEYLNGEIFAMAGGSEAHILISTNLLRELSTQLKGRPCKTYTSDMKVEVASSGLFTYPDVTVVCGPAQFRDKRRDVVQNPRVIVEVLSPSTEAYDRGAKFAQYRRIESLTDYFMVGSVEPRVEHYRRQEDGAWLLLEVFGLEGSVPIDSIGCDLLMREIFDRVEFEQQGPPGIH